MNHHRRRLLLARLSLLLAAAGLFTTTGLLGAHLERKLASATLGAAAPSPTAHHGENFCAPAAAPLDASRFARRS